jgi:hypothetical protein
MYGLHHENALYAFPAEQEHQMPYNLTQFAALKEFLNYNINEATMVREFYGSGQCRNVQNRWNSWESKSFSNHEMVKLIP